MAIKTIIDVNGIRSETADRASVEIVDPVTVRSSLFDGSGQQIGRQGPPGGPTPYVDLASTFGMHPTASATQNTQGYWTWMSSSTYLAHTLLFDNRGTYDVSASVIAVPGLRTIKGVSGVTLRAVTSGTWLVAPNSSPATITDLTLDGNGCAKYCAWTSASLPPSAGSTMILERITTRGALTAGVFGFNSSVGLTDIVTTSSPTGIHLESCSELIFRNISQSFHSDACIRCIGSGTPDFGQQHNGGRANFYGIVQAVCNYGLDLLGIAQAGVFGITCEGALSSSIRLGRGTTNVRIYGSRTNSGVAVEFSGSLNCVVHGGCVSTQTVVHRALDQACYAYLRAESSISPVDILQVFSSSTGLWHAFLRHDGYVTTSGSAPTQGYWGAYEKVWRVPVSGQSQGYVSSVAGNPGTWVSMSNYQ